jgi:hypothetical protein
MGESTADLRVAAAGEYGSYRYGQEQEGKRRNRSWWLLLGAALLVVVVVAGFAVANLIGTNAGAGGGRPSGNPSQNVCPQVSADPSSSASPGYRCADGRAFGGKLSYELLGPPWGDPEGDDRAPYSSIAVTQTVLDQLSYDGGISSWVASVLIAELHIGDGFASTQQGVEIISRCVMGIFYADNELQQTDTTSAAYQVDGHDGWKIDTTLHFSIPGLIATSERAIVIVVRTGDTDYSLFYTSVPNTREYLQPDADRAIASLRVDG